MKYIPKFLFHFWCSFFFSCYWSFSSFFSRIYFFVAQFPRIYETTNKNIPNTNLFVTFLFKVETLNLILISTWPVITNGNDFNKSVITLIQLTVKRNSIEMTEIQTSLYIHLQFWKWKTFFYKGKLLSLCPSVLYLNPFITLLKVKLIWWKAIYAIVLVSEELWSIIRNSDRPVASCI